MTRKKRKWLIISGGLVTAAVVGSAFFFLQPTKGAAANPIIPQTVGEIMESSVKETDTLLTGKVTPKETEKIALDAQKGVVSEILVNEGDQVNAGQPLFRYTNPDGQLEIKQAELDQDHANNVLGQKQEVLGQKQTQVSNKWGEYNRSNQEKRETIKTEIDQLNLDILAAQADLEAAQSDLDKSIAKLENTREKYNAQEVTSKVTGTVKKINRGMLDKSDSEKNSEPFIEIVDTSEIFVKGNVNEFQKEKIRVDQPVTLIDRTDQTKTWTGKIVSVDNLASEDQKDKDNTSDENPNLTKFPYRVKFDNPEGTPPNGKHVFVKPEEETPDGVVLPAEYLVYENDKVYVWKVVKQELKKTEVEVQPLEGQEMLAVTNGLAKEDQIVIPQPDFKVGTKVTSSDSLKEMQPEESNDAPNGGKVMEVPMG